MDYKLQRKRLRRCGSYIKSPEWLLHKGSTINPKNRNDGECLPWSIISALNYNEITKKKFENIFKKINMNIKIFITPRRLGKFEQDNESITHNVLIPSQESKEITLVYKSEHNLERENEVLLLMINDNDADEKYYCFAIKRKLELYSLKWLRSKKESLTNEDSCFQNALNDSLEYQRIKKDPQKISKLKPYVNKI